MSLRECMTKHTHREYLTWCQWLEDQWNVTTPTQNYLMQIAAEVRRVLSKDPTKILTKNFQLTFTRKKDDGKKVITEEDIAEATARSKSFWGALKSMVGGKDGSRNRN